MIELNFDVVVIGGGPSGLASAIEADKECAKVLLVDREKLLGGILKQCIHDGFGLTRYKKQMSGPSYAELDILALKESKVEVMSNAFVLKLTKNNDLFTTTIQTDKGMAIVKSKSVVVATGCRERTKAQVCIHGNRPSGIFNAGTAQNLVNLQGVMPGKNIVILGSGDIGLIMARRLTLEGAKVLGVYEAKATPSGLERNIHQCLEDFNIPLHLSCTVTKVIGDERVEAVEVAKVDERMTPISGTEKIIPCDTLVLSVGLIPEIELIKPLNLKLNRRTQSVEVDQYGETSLKNLFIAGNAQMVFDLVDYVSEKSKIAGAKAAKVALEETKDVRAVTVESQGDILFASPNRITLDSKSVKLFFRSAKDMKDSTLTISDGSKVIREIKYSSLLPPKMESVVLALNQIESDKITLSLSEDK